MDVEHLDDRSRLLECGGLWADEDGRNLYYVNCNGETVGHMGISLLDIPKGGMGGTWTLSVFVNPETRKQGIGKILLGHSERLVSQAIKEMGVKSGTFSLVNAILPSEVEEGIEDWLKRNGYREITDLKQPEKRVYLKEDISLGNFFEGPKSKYRNVSMPESFWKHIDAGRR